MAEILSCTVLELPNQSNFSGQANPCPVLGVAVNKIQNISPLTTSQATAYPAATASIEVVYNVQQQVYTGSYIVGVDSVATLITNSNA